MSEPGTVGWEEARADRAEAHNAELEARVGELEAEQSWHNVRACPHCGGLMPEVENKQIVEAQRAVVDTTMAVHDNEATEDWYMRNTTLEAARTVACKALAKLRETGGR